MYERDSKLTEQGIASIRNFGMIGIYFLEPAEPVPPMTEDDVKFERFQTINVFAIQDDQTGCIMLSGQFGSGSWKPGARNVEILYYKV